MVQVTVKVELNNLDKARAEVNALLVYIDELAKTYAPDMVFASQVTDKPEPKKVTVKGTAKVDKTEPKAEATATKKRRVAKLKAKVEPEPEPTPEPTKTAVDAKSLIALARETVARGVDRNKIKAIIAEYGASKIDSIPTDKMAEFAEKVKAL